jgi:ribonuclease VapC
VYVLDSSVVLAILYEETGAEMAVPMLENACISTVILCETAGCLIRDGMDIRDVEQNLKDLIEKTIPFDNAIAMLAASYIPQTKAFGLSLGDRACLATAQKLGAIAVTADTAWAKLKLPVKIKLIR